MYVYTYGEYEEGDCDLHGLLEEDALDDGPLGDNVLLVLVGLWVEAVVVEGAEEVVDAGVDPVDTDGHKSAEQLIGHLQRHLDLWSIEEEEEEDDEEAQALEFCWLVALPL